MHLTNKYNNRINSLQKKINDCILQSERQKRSDQLKKTTEEHKRLQQKYAALNLRLWRIRIKLMGIYIT